MVAALRSEGGEEGVTGDSSTRCTLLVGVVGGAGTWAGRGFTVALASKILILSAMGVRPTTLDSLDMVVN